MDRPGRCGAESVRRADPAAPSGSPQRPFAENWQWLLSRPWSPAAHLEPVFLRARCAVSEPSQRQHHEAGDQEPLTYLRGSPGAPRPRSGTRPAHGPCSPHTGVTYHPVAVQFPTFRPPNLSEHPFRRDAPATLMSWLTRARSPSARAGLRCIPAAASLLRNTPPLARQASKIAARQHCFPLQHRIPTRHTTLFDTRQASKIAGTAAALLPAAPLPLLNTALDTRRKQAAGGHGRHPSSVKVRVTVGVLGSRPDRVGVARSMLARGSVGEVGWAGGPVGPAGRLGRRPVGPVRRAGWAGWAGGPVGPAGQRASGSVRISRRSGGHPVRHKIGRLVGGRDPGSASLTWRWASPPVHGPPVRAIRRSAVRPARSALRREALAGSAGMPRDLQGEELAARSASHPKRRSPVATATAARGGAAGGRASAPARNNRRSRVGDPSPPHATTSVQGRRPRRGSCGRLDRRPGISATNAVFGRVAGEPAELDRAPQKGLRQDGARSAAPELTTKGHLPAPKRRPADPGMAARKLAGAPRHSDHSIIRHRQLLTVTPWNSLPDLPLPSRLG